MVHSLSWFLPGKTIKVKDKMQSYTYRLTESPGKHMDPEFKPELTPKQILAYGAFEGKYMRDCAEEFPKEWFVNAKFSKTKDADPSINLFKIKSRQSLMIWRENGWIIGHDPRGWFQWYCRYYLGRRDAVDQKQIMRWRSFTRHRGQILASIKRMKYALRPKKKSEILLHRPKQRQALLQWAYNPWVTIG